MAIDRTRYTDGADTCGGSTPFWSAWAWPDESAAGGDDAGVAGAEVLGGAIGDRAALVLLDRHVLDADALDAGVADGLLGFAVDQVVVRLVLQGEVVGVDVDERTARYRLLRIPGGGDANHGRVVRGTAPVNVYEPPNVPGMIVYDGSMNGVMRQ